MHEYDTALKSVLMRLAGSVLRELTGFAVTRWSNIELPEVRNRRVDLLGETADGRLVHIELQSTNDPDMPLRMAEYGWAIYRQFRRFPEQIVLYIGQAPLRMANRLESESLSVRYGIVDIRTQDAGPLLASQRVEDNIIALLMRFRDQRGTVRRILGRIAETDPGRRRQVLGELLILAGLRSLEEVVTQEVKHMPILNDIMDHKVFGPKIREGIEIGRREGREEGREEGRTIEARQVVLRMAEKRFGSVHQRARQKIEAMSADVSIDLCKRDSVFHSLEGFWF